MAVEFPIPLIVDLTRTSPDRRTGSGHTWSRLCAVASDSWGLIYLPPDARYVLVSAGPGASGLTGVLSAVGVPSLPPDATGPFAFTPIGLMPRLFSVEHDRRLSAWNTSESQNAYFGVEIFTHDDAPEIRAWLPR